jgi:hypothetical protein
MSLEAAGLICNIFGATLLWSIRPPTLEFDETFATRLRGGPLTRLTMGRDGYLSGPRLKHSLATSRVLSGLGWCLMAIGFVVQLVASW